MFREAEGQQGTELPPFPEKFSSMGRNSLDVFSPARDASSLDSRTPGMVADSPLGRTPVTSLEILSREGEGQQYGGRASLDIFSPVREDGHSAASSLSKTPLMMPLVASGGRIYTPLSNFQTPPPIKEEEPVMAAAAESSDSRKPDKASSSSLEGETQTPPTSSQQANYNQLAPPFFTPEPSLRRANGVPAQLSYDSPLVGALPSHSAGPALAAAVSSSLSQNIADVVGQAGAAPLNSLQIHFIQNMIHDTLEDFRDTCHRDIVNLQVEMVRQFYIQLNEIHGLIEKYSVNESLVEEIEKLREENRRLRANY